MRKHRDRHRERANTDRAICYRYKTHQFDTNIVHRRRSQNYSEEKHINNKIKIRYIFHNSVKLQKTNFFCINLRPAYVILCAYTHTHSLSIGCRRLSPVSTPNHDAF